LKVWVRRRSERMYGGCGRSTATSLKVGDDRKAGSTLPTEYEDVQKSEKFRFLRITIS
jgi:hypothetical protein